MMTRPAKKNVTIEIRLPDATKTQFMEQCRLDGQSASQVIRAFIDRETSSARPKGPKRGRMRIGVAAMLGAAFGAVAAPAIAHSLPGTATACSASTR